jgi:hypothetical protein
MNKRKSFLIGALATVHLPLITLGTYMLYEAAYFYVVKADKFTKKARETENPQERELWLIGAAEARGIAAFDAAMAAGLFSFASLILGWTSFIRSLMVSNNIPLPNKPLEEDLRDASRPAAPGLLSTDRAGQFRTCPVLSGRSRD